MTEEASFSAPRGTYDLIPPDSWRWEHLRAVALDDVFAAAGYQPIETPVFEHTEVFSRGVGAASEVVTKQMYTFEDRGGRSLTLRPEGTAPVMRSVLEHGLERGPLPAKLSYAIPMFRQERPQKGRYRQFWQLGIEAIGTESPVVDAEVIEIGMRYLTGVGLDATLMLNSIGHPGDGCRATYLEALTAFLREHENEIAVEDRDRIRLNPLRTFDSKEAATIAVMEGAPLISEHLCSDCRAHFGAVTDLLDVAGVSYTLEPRLVRGLDYYTRTTFEFVASGLGAQDSVGGGGRYDGLAEALGGPRLPGIGFALGADRILLAGGASQVSDHHPRAYVVTLGDEARTAGFRIVSALRARGVAAEMDLGARGMKGQMKDADRSGADLVVIVGESELASGTATIKDLRSGRQIESPLDTIDEDLATGAIDLDA
ncbi:MAG: histidyl-tRNA synthetase [Actinomycetota bacterium]|nr:histidyl-tRNA synthetase [Actinomycetota bacterium]